MKHSDDSLTVAGPRFKLRLDRSEVSAYSERLSCQLTKFSQASTIDYRRSKIFSLILPYPLGGLKGTHDSFLNVSIVVNLPKIGHHSIAGICQRRPLPKLYASLFLRVQPFWLLVAQLVRGAAMPLMQCPYYQFTATHFADLRQMAG